MMTTVTVNEYGTMSKKNKRNAITLEIVAVIPPRRSNKRVYRVYNVRVLDHRKKVKTTFFIRCHKTLEHTMWLPYMAIRQYAIELSAVEHQQYELP
jgi:hypothetical protein